VPYNEPWENPADRAAALTARLQKARAARDARRLAALAEVPADRKDSEERRLLAEDETANAADESAAWAALRTAAAQRQAWWRTRPRRHLLVSASLTVTGPSPGALGFEAFLVQREYRSGAQASFAPALALEAEPFANLLKVRAGSYLEPSRFADSDLRDAEPRLHGTAGLDLRLFESTIFGLFSPFHWRTGGTVDVAPAWFNFSVSLGLWH